MARTVVSALVNSRLDNANSVLYSISAENISRLQRVQNALARVATYTKRAKHILHNLFWLPINYRIEHKLTALAFKIWSTGSPAYRLSAVCNYIPTPMVISQLLFKPAVRTGTTRRSFNLAAPSVWNSLPVEIRISETERQFRTAIRTHYYRISFNFLSRFDHHTST